MPELNHVRSVDNVWLTPYPRGVYAHDMKNASEGAKDGLIARLKIIEGQVRGLQNMVNASTYCIDVITQTSAIKQALSGIEDILMENHLGTCAVEQIKKGKEGFATAEILKVYRLKRK